MSGIIENEAKKMAEAINGGSWDEDYTDAQKVGWRQKVEWAIGRYGPCGFCGSPFHIPRDNPGEVIFVLDDA